MAFKQVSNINIENAKLMFKNFAGDESKFNRRGNRNFCVRIEDPELAATLASDGWNVKTLRPREEGDPESHYIQVTVNYDYIPPTIYLINSAGKTLMTEETVGTLDYLDIANVDLCIRPYCWEVNGNTGIKAYVKTMYVTIDEDVFAAKYSSKPAQNDELPFI